ncbi:MAG TPA: MBL fold metallo-hydrolase [Bacillota bacterium]
MGTGRPAQGVERITGGEPAPRKTRLTILGRCSPFPGTAGGCPGYLLESGGVKVLVDCGPGTLGRLAPRLKDLSHRSTTASPYAGLDAVVVSHLHADHFSELLSLRYAIDADIRDGYRKDRLAVHVPPEPEAERAVLDYPRALDLATIDESSQLAIGPLAFSFRRTNHPVHCLAMKIRAGGSTLVYTADTGWDDDLMVWAGHPSSPDLLLVEASLQEASAHRRDLGHLTAREAGCFGRGTGAGLTILTHLYPEFDLEVSRREAEKGAGSARTVIPVEGQEFTF